MVPKRKSLDEAIIAVRQVGNENQPLWDLVSASDEMLRRMPRYHHFGRGLHEMTLELLSGGEAGWLVKVDHAEAMSRRRFRGTMIPLKSILDGHFVPTGKSAFERIVEHDLWALLHCLCLEMPRR